MFCERAWPRRTGFPTTSTLYTNLLDGDAATAVTQGPTAHSRSSWTRLTTLSQSSGEIRPSSPPFSSLPSHLFPSSSASPCPRAVLCYPLGLQPLLPAITVPAAYVRRCLAHRSPQRGSASPMYRVRVATVDGETKMARLLADGVKN